MLEIYMVSFFGHRYIENFRLAEEKVDKLIHKLLQEHEYVEFLVGRDGDFDQLATSAVKRAQHSYAKHRCDITWVMPYLKAEYTKNVDNLDKYYDYVEICPESEKVHPKQAIQVRNCYMVDRSDLSVFWVDHEKGGAYKTMKYAAESGKDHKNLYEK